MEECQKCLAVVARACKQYSMGLGCVASSSNNALADAALRSGGQANAGQLVHHAPRFPKSRLHNIVIEHSSLVPFFV